MGALISFETARYCRKYHLATPMHLFISGHGAPHLSRDEPPLYDLPEAEFLNELYQLNGTPPEVLAHEELMQLMLPILRADFAVCETYAYEPEAPLGCPITVFGGLEDPGVQVDELKAWREQTSSVCSVRMFPGDHFFLQAMPSLFLQTLARELHMLRV
jgi:medium-chain acyl-[acyl-carrier-protein] hydrolase